MLLMHTMPDFPVDLVTTYYSTYMDEGDFTQNETHQVTSHEGIAFISVVTKL